ncbi:MAG TPA: hypothetical protein VMI53_08150 [Opitutaceae bacterium]|nr:hypothetical protein [Opitutaceae bacterium]
MQPKPAHFDNQVRRPGRQFLRQIPHPTSAEWAEHSYWRRILEPLHTAYSGICAYSCHWIPYDTGADTVEHFLPKTTHPNKAYEWTNYRLACATLNGRKGIKRILDPFEISDGWFTIDFPSLLILPAPGLDARLSKRITDTRDLLGLNDEGTCLRARQRYVKNFCQGMITFDFLRQDAPFIASEIRRQGLEATLPEIMGYSR